MDLLQDLMMVAELPHEADHRLIADLPHNQEVNQESYRLSLSLAVLKIVSSSQTRSHLVHH